MEPDPVDRQENDMLLKGGFVLKDGLSAFGPTQKIPGLNIFFVVSRCLAQLVQDGKVADQITLEPGVVLVHNGETTIFAQYDDLYDAVSGQRHAVIGYGVDGGMELTGELAGLEGLIEEAQTAQRLALEYKMLDEGDFEKALKNASRIFTGLFLARNPGKKQAKERALLVTDMVTKRNPSATAATALAIHDGLVRRSQHVSTHVGPGVAMRATVLVGCRNRYLAQFRDLMSSLATLERSIYKRRQSWDNGRDLSQRDYSARHVDELVSNWIDRRFPNPFHGIATRVTDKLLRIAQGLRSGNHGRSYTDIQECLQDIAIMFLQSEIESVRYTILLDTASSESNLCIRVGRLIALARQLDERLLPTQRLESAMNCMFRALYHGSQGDAKNTRVELKNSAIALN